MILLTSNKIKSLSYRQKPAVSFVLTTNSPSHQGWSTCSLWACLVRTGKGQFSFQSQRKAMPKNAQTTAQLYSFHTLVK